MTASELRTKLTRCSALAERPRCRTKLKTVAFN